MARGQQREGLSIATLRRAREELVKADVIYRMGDGKASEWGLVKNQVSTVNNLQTSLRTLLNVRVLYF